MRHRHRRCGRERFTDRTGMRGASRANRTAPEVPGGNLKH
jgi:hypothetical protein